MRQKSEAHISVQKLIPNVNPQYRQEWNLPEDHESAGLISCDNEDVLILALDDATKKDRIHVVHVEKSYVGGTRLLGEFEHACNAIISGPKVQDVKSGLSHIREYVEKKCAHYTVGDSPCVNWYADWVPRAGKYMQERLGISGDTSYCYLYSTPMESTYAMDAAMKASNTSLAEISNIVTRDNRIGVILTGTESACRAATEAYSNAIERFAASPLNPEV